MATSDAGEIAELMCILGYPTSTGEMKERIQQMLAHPDYQCFISQLKGEINGFIGLVKTLRFQRNGQTGRIATLIVHPDFRNRGIGSILVKKAENWFQSQGIDIVILTSSTERIKAHKFYGKLGYSETGLRLAKSIEP